jgi:hypothetical protein
MRSSPLVDQCIQPCLHLLAIAPMSLSIAFEVYGMSMPWTASLANVTMSLAFFDMNSDALA